MQTNVLDIDHFVFYRINLCFFLQKRVSQPTSLNSFFSMETNFVVPVTMRALLAGFFTNSFA